MKHYLIAYGFDDGWGRYLKSTSKNLRTKEGVRALEVELEREFPSARNVFVMSVQELDKEMEDGQE